MEVTNPITSEGDIGPDKRGSHMESFEFERSLSQLSDKNFKLHSSVKGKIDYLNLYGDEDFQCSLEKTVDDRTVCIGVLKSVCFTLLLVCGMLSLGIFYGTQESSYTVIVNDPTYDQFLAIKSMNPSCTCKNSMLQHSQFLNQEATQDSFCSLADSRKSINAATTNQYSTCNVVANCIQSWEGDGWCDSVNNQQSCNWDGKLIEGLLDNCLHMP
jgi:hypothetical protein